MRIDRLGNLQHLIVLISDELQCPEAGVEVAAGTETVLECSVVFQTYPVNSYVIPGLTWSTENETLSQSNGYSNDTYVVYV